MSDYGIKSVKPEVNIKSKYPPDWNLNTKYPLLKIFSITRDTFGATDYTITHDLGYRPLTMVWFEDPYDEDNYFFGTYPADFPILGQRITNTQVILSGVENYNFICYIFYDEM